jgi:hypothetical protein
MKLFRIAPLLLLVPGCLENEEELEVRPDGSVHVTVSAKGDVRDLADGYPVPLDAGWRPVNDDAQRWMADIGPDTGSAHARKRVDELHWKGTGRNDPPEAHLVVERTFPSVEALPACYAGEREPYRGAYLQRATSLRVRELEGRRVYVFERTVRGFDVERMDPGKRIALSDVLRSKLEHDEPLTADERRTVADAAVTAFEDIAATYAGDALLGLFTQGDAALAPERVAAIQADVRAAARATVSPQRIAVLLDVLEREEDAAAGEAFEQLDADWRAALRSSFAAALGDAGVGAETRNAALYALEWSFTAYDHHLELGDEKFVLDVKLPGVLVGGNYTGTEDGAARFEFEGSALAGKDVVLRAVSVLEG